MINTLLRNTGESLYGPRWQSDLARDFNIADRTIRRWLASADALPPGVTLDLVHLCSALSLIRHGAASRVRRRRDGFHPTFFAGTDYSTDHDNRESGAYPRACVQILFISSSFGVFVNIQMEIKFGYNCF